MKAKHRLFIAAYLDCWNATEATKRAGYSERRASQTGYDLLKRPEIKQAIGEAIEERAMSSEEALDRLGRQARADMADYAAAVGYPELREERDAGRLDTSLIHKFVRRKAADGSERISLELYDAQRAAIMILKAAGELEEQIVLRYDQQLDSLLGALVAEFGGPGDEDIFERIKERLDEWQARDRRRLRPVE